jgi:ribosome-associated heat shock protein Hsp15
MEGQRLDKWLWCARLVKTRTLAVRLIEGGKVRLNGERALKVSRRVRLGDVVTGTGAGPGRLFVVRVMGEAERRGAAPAARSLYENLTPDTPPAAPAARIEGHRGPRKRDRRRLDAIKADEA